MTALTPSRRPRAIMVLVAGLIWWFLASLAPLAAAGLNLKRPVPIVANIQRKPVLLAHALAFLILNPLAAALILRRRPAGHWLVLALVGYLTIRSATLLLIPYTWNRPSDTASRALFIFAATFTLNLLLLYLALRPEVISYTHPERD